MDGTAAVNVCGEAEAPSAASAVLSSAASSPAVPQRISYACRRCRAHLFTHDDVVPHETGAGAKKDFKYRRGAPQTSEHDATSDGASVGACTSYFLDPDARPWVAEELREANAAGAAVDPDIIYCPNARCRAKLGTQSWTGSRCSCGAWVTPAFRIHTRAVDKSTDTGPAS